MFPISGRPDVFEDEKHVVTGGQRLRDIRVVDGGRTLALEIVQTDRRLLTLLLPAEEALDIGSRLMVAAANAKLMIKGEGGETSLSCR